MSTSPELDTSWDVSQVESTVDGYIATRPRAEDRPQAPKTILDDFRNHLSLHRQAWDRLCSERIKQAADGLRKDMNDVRAEIGAKHRQELADLKAEIGKHQQDVNDLRADSTRLRKYILSMQRQLGHQSECTVNCNNVTEAWEVVARCIQAFNDFVFDPERPASGPEEVILTVDEKAILTSSGLIYLTQLLNPPNDLPARVDTVRLRALSILSPQQQDLCRVLVTLQDSNTKQNFIHHRRPDRTTVMDRLDPFLDDEEKSTLRAFLDTNPERLSSRRAQIQDADEDLYLFAPEGSYKNVAKQKQDLEGLKAEIAESEAYLLLLEQRSGTQEF
ncbi:hypothetical protein C8F01DRAFT_1106918 [Mycena amicta]|nr:hypothetical protein C8F01DRAFT_1106918 [Mycena amicta]